MLKIIKKQKKTRPDLTGQHTRTYTHVRSHNYPSHLSSLCFPYSPFQSLSLSLCLSLCLFSLFIHGKSQVNLTSSFGLGFFTSTTSFPTFFTLIRSSSIYLLHSYHPVLHHGNKHEGASVRTWILGARTLPHAWLQALTPSRSQAG
jgi:hypothetical protein